MGMASFRLTIVLAIISFISSVQGVPLVQDTQKHCPATLNWPGWGKVEYAFIL